MTRIGTPYADRLTLRSNLDCMESIAPRAHGYKGPEDNTAPMRCKSVLIIANRFPPAASVGATRIRKFVKYLSEYGWRPVVLTGSYESTSETPAPLDLDSLGDIPSGTIVHRVKASALEEPDRFARTVSASLSAVTRFLGADTGWWHERIGWRLEGLIARATIPDRGTWRLPRVVAAALRLHRRYRFSAIFSSGMPFSDHLAGLAVRRILVRPWLADFRDPWVEYVHWDQWNSACGRRITRELESLVIRNAARVISVNDAMTRRFAERYSQLPADRFLTIPNGYDPADFPARASENRRDTFRLVYAGSLYDTRRPDSMLAGFRRFLEMVPDARRFARFDFIGRAGAHTGKFDDPALGACVHHCGWVPHSEALRAMADADLNVVILPSVRGGESDTTAKIYECLGSGRPVLGAVPPEGAAAAVLRAHEGVSICAPDDVESIAAAIRDWYGRWLMGDMGVERSADALVPLTRRHQAARLARALDAAAFPTRRISGGDSA